MSDDPFDARRRIERRMVTLDTVVKGSNGLLQPTTLLNLSPLGVRGRGGDGLVPGDHVRLELSRHIGAVTKIVWTSGAEFGGVFPTFVPLGGLASAEPSAETPAEECDFRIEYGPPGDRRTVTCPTARNAIDWYDEIVSAGLPFVRILNAQGDVVSAQYLRLRIAG